MFATAESPLDDFGADRAVGNSVAAIGHREMHARTVLHVRPEERQTIGGLGERPRPGVRDGE